MDLLIVRFDGLADFLRVAAKTRLPSRHPDGSDDKKWDGGLTTQESMERAVTGDPSIAAQTSIMLERLEPVYAEIESQGWSDTLVGPRVNVPAFVSGNPLCMRARRPRLMSGRTVRIFVDIVSSVTLSADTLIKRGVTVLALLESLQQNRIDVEILLLCSGATGRENFYDYGGGQEKELTFLIPLECKPLDLSVVGFVLAHPSFPRNVIYQVGERDHQQNHMLSPAFRKHRDNPQAYDTWARGYLGMEPQDVFIPLSYGGDELIENPERWLQQRVTQIVTGVSLWDK